MVVVACWRCGSWGCQAGKGGEGKSVEPGGADGGGGEGGPRAVAVCSEVVSICMARPDLMPMWEVRDEIIPTPHDLDRHVGGVGWLAAAGE